jgi:hypothetical protein
MRYMQPEDAPCRGDRDPLTTWVGGMILTEKNYPERKICPMQILRQS